MPGLGPLQDPATWYGKNHAGTQVTQWDLQNKGTLSSPTTNNLHDHLVLQPVVYIGTALSILFSPSSRLIGRRNLLERLCCDIYIPEVMKTASANLNFLCNFSQLSLSNISLFTVLFTACVGFFRFLSLLSG